MVGHGDSYSIVGDREIIINKHIIIENTISIIAGPTTAAVANVNTPAKAK